MSTQYILAATGGDYSAYPLRKADFTDWATVAVDLVEEGSTGKYASSSLHRGFGDQWAVFNKTVASGAPAAWTDAVDKIDLGDAGGWLNVCRDTPYGIQTPNAGNIANAVNWALKYQGVEDPANRVPVGGPNGCFTPYIPKCDNNKYWLSTGQWFVPNRRGVELRGGGFQRDASTGGTSTSGAAKVRFNLSDNTKPAIINQANSFVISDVTFYTLNSTAIGMLNHRVTSEADQYYVENNSEGFGTGSGGSQGVTQMLMTRCGWDGFGIGIQNGGTTGETNCDHHTLIEVSFDDCGTAWKNINHQGVHIKFLDCSWRVTSGGIFADFQAGGHCIIDSLFSNYADSKMLNIGQGPTKLNGYFKLRDIKTDANGPRSYIVYMEDDPLEDGNLDRWVQVFVDGIHHSRYMGDSSKTEAFHMVGRSKLVIRDGVGIGRIETVGGDPGGAYVGQNFAPTILLESPQYSFKTDGDDPESLIDGPVSSFRAINPDMNYAIGATTRPTRTLPTELRNHPPSSTIQFSNVINLP